MVGGEIPRLMGRHCKSLSFGSDRPCVDGYMDGACISPSGSAWRTHDWSETGWSEVSSSTWASWPEGCRKFQSNVSEEHHNNAFCAPKNIRTHYPDVHVWISGDYFIGGGDQFSSYVSHHDWTWLPCPPLQRNAALYQGA